MHIECLPSQSELDHMLELWQLRATRALDVSPEGPKDDLPAPVAIPKLKVLIVGVFEVVGGHQQPPSSLHLRTETVKIWGLFTQNFQIE